MKTVSFYTLGCKLNFSETSAISRTFQEEGYSKVPFEQGADVCVINTCSVTDNADKKCRKVVRDALKKNPNAFITVIGCYAQLKPKQISEIPGVDAVLGAAEKFELLQLLGDFEKTGGSKIYHQDIKETQDFHHSYSLNDRTRTFLKVQDGCNYNCSFCTIPLARGKSRSDTIESIVASTKEIAKTDVREIVLTGVNIGDFGIKDGKRKETFLQLITELDQIEGIDRFRISSIEPNLLNDDVISFVNKSKRFVPHFHVPLQSGSDKLLKSMRRRYDRSLYTSRVNQIKRLMPDCCIGVDVIVGYPGETDAEFNETYNYLSELPISYLHVFTYSERDNTHAVELGEAVDPKIRTERSQMLRNLSEKKKRAFYNTQLGSTHDVLFESKNDNGFMNGFTENYVKVSVPFNEGRINQIESARLMKHSKKGEVLVELV